MKNNTVAIVILAHHNPKHLTLLINRLKDDFDVYVQIDAKSVLDIALLPKHNNVYYYKSVKVFWGHVSQIHNMEFIFREAFNKSYERYCMISGDDFPIKPNSYIKEFFKNRKDKIFMYANPLPIKTWGFNHGFDRLDRYWFMKFNNRIFVKAFGRLTLLLQRALGIKLKRFPLKYYAGSNWINLSHESLEYVFNYLNKHPQFLNKLKYSRATDEIWIQSIIMNSPLKEKVINDDLRYIDWVKGPDYPRVLDETDLINIEQSKALFARKINFENNRKFILKFQHCLK